jgi:phosphoesterase RecJ-like protein
MLAASTPEALRSLVAASRRVLLTGPEGPDGDSIGACLALQRALRQVEPGVEVAVTGDPGFRYRWLPGAAEMVPDDGARPAEGVVVLDGDCGRLPKPITAHFHAARWTGLFDHHRSTSLDAYTWTCFDPAAESTCVLVRDVMRAWDVPLDRDLATLLYTGLIFDTGGFRYSNTRPSTHAFAAELLALDIDHVSIMARTLVERRKPGLALLGEMAAGTEYWCDGRVAVGRLTRATARRLGAEDADVEGIVDVLLHAEGVQAAVVGVEKADGRSKISLRARVPVDLAAVARAVHPSGGGHAKAAGVAVAEPLEGVLARVRAELARALG